MFDEWSMRIVSWHKELATLIKRNSMFLVILIGLLLALVMKNNEQTAVLVNYPDQSETISLYPNTEVLSQTWMPMAKKITKISVPFETESSNRAVLELLVYNDSREKLLGTCDLSVNFENNTNGYMEFDFGEIPVTAGCRYHFDLFCKEVSEDGTSISFPTGTNSGGLTISGVNADETLAMKVSYAKNSAVFWLIFSLFPLLSGALCLALFTGRRFESVIVIPLLAEGLILYLFGITNHLVIGLKLVYWLSFLVLLACIVWTNYRKTDIFEWTKQNSFGICFFGIMVLLIIFINKGEWLGNRDELRHWGIAVRDMFYYDAFMNHYNCNLILYRYVPFTATIEYAFEYMNGFFAEDILFIAYQILLLTFVTPFIRFVTQKKALILPVLVGIVGLPIFFCNYVSSTIMPDTLLGVMFAYGLIAIYQKKWDKLSVFSLYLVMMVLPLVKDIGMVVGGLLAIIWVLDEITEEMHSGKYELRKLSMPVIGGCLVLLAYFSWQGYLKSPIQDYRTPTHYEEAEINVESSSDNLLDMDMTLVASAQEDVHQVAYIVRNYSWVSADGEANIAGTYEASGIHFKEVAKILIGRGDFRQKEIFRNFVWEFANGETFTAGNMKVSCLAVWVFLLGMMIILSVTGFWEDKTRRIKKLAIILTAAFGIYLFVLLMTYWFTFSANEGSDLTSFGRYTSVVLLGSGMLVLYMIMDQYTQLEAKKDLLKTGEIILTIFVGLLLVITPLERTLVKSKDYNSNVSEDMIYGYEDILNILQTVAGRDDKAFFVCSESSGWSSYLFRNRVNPISSDYENWNIVANEEDAVSEDIYSIPVVMSAEQLNDRLSECQYMVIFHCNDTFRRDYEMFFDNPEDIQDGSVFRVDYGENTKCYLIGRTGIKAYH